MFYSSFKISFHLNSNFNISSPSNLFNFFHRNSTVIMSNDNFEFTSLNVFFASTLSTPQNYDSFRFSNHYVTIFLLKLNPCIVFFV